MLRRMRADDAADVFAYASDPQVARLVTWEAHASIEDSRRFLDALLQQYAAGAVAPWGVLQRGEGKIIGTCGFMWWRPRHARAEIAYAMGRRHWNRGVMTEAVRAVIRFGFERMGLNRIEARCLPENVGSERVMQKAGMAFEGILREHMFVKGRFDDLKLYSILRREYKARDPGAGAAGTTKG